MIQSITEWSEKTGNTNSSLRRTSKLRVISAFSIVDLVHHNFCFLKTNCRQDCITVSGCADRKKGIERTQSRTVLRKIGTMAAGEPWMWRKIHWWPPFFWCWKPTGWMDQTGAFFWSGNDRRSGKSSSFSMVIFWVFSIRCSLALKSGRWTHVKCLVLPVEWLRWLWEMTGKES